MSSLQVCYVPTCKNIATRRCAGCMKPICDEHSWWNHHAQADPGDIDRRCPECYSAFMSRRFREAMEELTAARADLAKARLEVAAMAREAGLCIPASSSVGCADRPEGVG